MLVPFSQVSLSDAVALWNRTLPLRFQIDEAVFEINTKNDWVLPEASFGLQMGGDLAGFVVCKRSPAGAFPDVDPNLRHIHALVFDSPEVGTLLATAAMEALRAGSPSKIVFGQDLRHFFPGVPREFVAHSEILKSVGLTAREAQCDLERDLRGYEVPEGVMERASKAEFRACSEADLPLLDEFLLRAFPRRWRYDVLDKIQVEGRTDIVFAVFQEGFCEGFAITQEATCKMPIGGGVWRNDLGENWGSLGPIGVSERVRGQGLGNAILGFALAGLRDRGVRQCIIDWTTLREFYGGHGFVPTREYTTYALEL